MSKESFQSEFEKAVQIRKTTVEYNKIGIECEVCEKIFFRTHNFTVHSCEQVLKNIVCIVCQKRFSSQSRLKRHLMVHSGEKLCECEICKRRFAQKSDLTRHRMLHAEVRVNPLTNEKSCKCRLCGKVFRSTVNMGIHLARHKVAKPYRCRICQRGFSIKYNLKRHMDIHRYRKMFKCETCGKSFLSKISLEKHMEVHVESALNEDPLSKQNLMLQCQTCSRIILHKSQLQRHSTNHPNFLCLSCKEYYMNCKCSEDHIDDSEVSKTRNTYSKSKGIKTEDSGVQNRAIVTDLDDQIKEEPARICKIDMFNDTDQKSVVSVAKNELDVDGGVVKTEYDPVVFKEIDVDGTIIKTEYDHVEFKEKDEPVELEFLNPKEEYVDVDEKSAKYGKIFIEES